MNKTVDKTQNSPPENFAIFLRQSRIRLRKTMGEVARDLGITVVYYSEVESGKKPAFPDKKVSYMLLAKVLQIPEENLKAIANFDREKRDILKRFPCNETTAHLAVAFGRRLTNNALTEKQLQKIQKILNEGE